jgi:hypothetical protein
VVQRANGEPGTGRELADQQAVVGRDPLHGSKVRPDGTSGSTEPGRSEHKDGAFVSTGKA